MRLLICKDCGAIVADVKELWIKHANWHEIFNDDKLAATRFMNADNLEI